MKQPTRFERMIPGWEQSDADDIRARMIPATTMVQLLRREHRAVLRHVNGVLRKLGHRKNLTAAGHGYVAAYEAMRDWLTKRAR